MLNNNTHGHSFNDHFPCKPGWTGCHLVSTQIAILSVLAAQTEAPRLHDITSRVRNPSRSSSPPYWSLNLHHQNQGLHLTDIDDVHSCAK